MNALLSTLKIIFILFIATPLFSTELVKLSSTENKAKYSLEDTARILRSRKIGHLELDHDDHVYKCITISKKAKDLEGAADAIVAFKTKFGYTLDDDEVNLIIRISRLNTELYAEIGHLSRKIGKKETSLKEHFNLVTQVERGNGEYLKIGLDRAYNCGYKMENDYFSMRRLNLLINVGKISDQQRFLDIYSSMRRVGMSKNINSRALEILYNLCQLKGDVAGTIERFLLVNKWKSRKQPGAREYYVVRDMMTGNDSHYPMVQGESKMQVVQFTTDFDSDEEVEVEVKKHVSPKVSKKVSKKVNKKVNKK